MGQDTPLTAPPSLERLVRKVIFRLLPILIVMYLLAYLDRSNIGFAKEQFQVDVGLSNAAYALGAGIFFIGYALVEVPSNVLMQRFGARFWLTRIMVSWGVVSACMAFASNEWSFYALRLLLGVAEAGFFPGVLVYLTHWIPLAHRARVNGIFCFGAPLAFVVGGPMSGALLDLHGLLGFAGWQIMFFVTGAVTVLIGLGAYWYLDNGPADAKWLNDGEKRLLMGALDHEHTAKEDHSPRTILASLKDRRVLYFALVYHLIQLSIYGVAFYLPTQVAAALGTTVGLEVGLLTAVPWAVALLGIVVFTRIADRTNRRRWTLCVTLVCAAVGILCSSLTNNPVWAIAALALAAAGFQAAGPIFWTLPSTFLAGTAAASGIAMINSVGALGGFVAPLAKTWAESVWGDQAGLMLLASIAALAAILAFVSHHVSPTITTMERRAREFEIAATLDQNADQPSR